MRIEPLNESHDRKGFDCGQNELNRWLAQVARQHQSKGISASFVAVEEKSRTVILGYYAINVAELRHQEIPLLLQAKLPMRAPVFRLGRLAVSVNHQKKGIGERLLFSAIDRVTRIAEEIGGVGLIVDAKPNAIAFYQRYGFIPLSDHPENLFLPFIKSKK